MKKFLLCIIGASIAATQASAQVIPATFDDLKLATESYWVGDVADTEYSAGMFTSGSFTFPNTYNHEYASWGLFGYADLTSTAYTSFWNMEDQMKNAVGGGHNSANYGVCYCDPYAGNADVKLESPAVVSGMWVTNTAWTLSSIKEGDNMTGPFATGDYLKLIVQNIKDNEATATVEFYLADYTDADAEKHYALDTWQWLDLSSLGETDCLRFSMVTTKTNEYGPLTPSYFAFDDLGANSQTAVSNLTADSEEDNVWYTLQGVKICNTPDTPGIYIHKGRKYIVK